jgi:glycosyltransferase involved in cell wall biosynthesis
MVAKVINIMPYPTAYELYWDEPKPKINWDIPNGQWAGIWDDEWLDLIGNEVLKLTREFEYEVWQPDLKVDKVYKYRFANSLCHVLYPSEYVKRLHGYKTVKYLTSKAMYYSLEREIKHERIILRTELVNRGLGRNVLNSSANVPTIAQFFGEIRDPLMELAKPKKNIPGKLHELDDLYMCKRLMQKIDVVTCSDARSLNNLERYFRGTCISLSIGIDFDFWRRRTDSARIRRALNLDPRSLVLFSSSRLNSLKQIDRVINVLNDLSDAANFVLVVTGHGEREYESHLCRLGEGLLKKGKLIFAGHVSDAELAGYYSIADLFIMSSLSEAGPTATVKALAMEVPVFSTDTGQMAEVLEKHGAGVIVPRRDYKAWKRELCEILQGKKLKILDREIVKKIHHWPYVAAQYVELYRKLFKRYYG